jgi:hypothetical protein
MIVLRVKVWAKMLLECYAIWINNNNDFGIFLRPIVISFKSRDKEIYNYNFLEDSDDEDIFDIPETEADTNIYTNINTTVKTGISKLVKNLNIEGMNKNKIDEAEDENDESSSIFSVDLNNQQKSMQNNIKSQKVKFKPEDNKYYENDETSTEAQSNMNINNETSDI